MATGALVDIAADRVHQVLTNLISNAAKFSRAGSKVLLYVDVDNSGVKVSVTDSGPRISTAFRDRVFKRFAKAESADSRRFDGTGLGFHICTVIVELHGGEIGIETELGAVTMFWFKLGTATPTTLESGHVLVVEESDDVAAKIPAVLARDGIVASVARDLDAATLLVDEQRFDALTIDARMGGGDPLALVRRLHEHARFRESPIVVVSPNKAEDPNIERVVGGLASWLRKPRELASALSTGRSVPEPPVVLHVEDDADLGRLGSAVIGPNFDTRTVSSFAAAREIFEREVTDLMILDVTLPDENGLDLVSSLHARQPGASVLVFSGHAADPRTVAGISASMVKSRTTEVELVALVRRLLRTPSRSMSQSLIAFKPTGRCVAPMA
ncbi:MAG: DNA-binding response OmpR family regulator [Bradymonadia bacterium]|jgi:DNA-binding response OmpR family regulator